MRLTIEALKEALMFADAEAETYLDRRTGETYSYSELLGEWDQEPPDDVESEHYVQLPRGQDLGLGLRRVALDFAREHMTDDDFERARDIFGRKGANSRFQALLARRGLLEQYYAFRDKAAEAALRAWCEEEGLELSD